MPNTMRKPLFSENKGNMLSYRMKRILDLIDETSLPESIKKMQKEGVKKVFQIGVGYLHNGFHVLFVQKILNRKVGYILNAYSEREINEILKLSTSHQQQGLSVLSKYHVPEEELLLLVMASRLGKLSKAAQQRVVFLYNQCFDEVE